MTRVAAVTLIAAGLAGFAELPAARTQTVTDKPRVFVLTDIENEPDDAQSMVRFLTYANHFDVEGLVATTSVHQRDKTAAWRIREIVQAYGTARDNLEKHEPGFPSAEWLLAVISEGLPAFGMSAVGEGRDSAGSMALIAAADRDDPRPLWVPDGEPGSLTTSSGRSGQPIEIQNFDQEKAWFTVPTQGVMPPGTGTMHIILAVTDQATPLLTRYRRVIVVVTP